MILRLTQSGKIYFDAIRAWGFTTSHDFVFLHNCSDDPCHAIAQEVGSYPESFVCGGTDEACNIDFHHHYNCNFGENMVVPDHHFTDQLQDFVNQGLLEIV